MEVVISMRKYKILFITTRLSPTPTANMINTMNVMEELKKKGHEIHCISVNQNEEINIDRKNGIIFYGIAGTNYAKILEKVNSSPTFINRIMLIALTIIRKVSNIIFLLKFPDVDPIQSRRVYKLASNIHKKEKLDCVIGVFRPFSGISAAIKMKEKSSDLLCGAYYLDLISGANKPTLVPNQIYKKLCTRGEKITFRKLDFILMAKGGKSIYDSDKFAEVNKKITYVDFPVFIKNNKAARFDFNNSKINIVFAGTLDKKFRNPKFMLEILSQTNEEIVLHIYGRGDCNKILDEYSQRNRLKLIYYGMRPHEEVLAAMQASNFIINISNKTNNMVPSKIFELFAIGKPIINFISNREDPSIPYFESYPSVKHIYEWLDVDEQRLDLHEFIISEKNKSYDTGYLSEVFKENTPEYTANIIESLINGHEEQSNE